MPTDPPASDLGALRERHQQDARLFWWTRRDGSRAEFHSCTGCSRQWPCETVQVLAAYDAQAARLAAWEQHQCPQYRQHHQSRLVQLRRTMAEREALAARLREVLDALATAEQRATRLAAALQWAVTTLDGYRATESADGLPDGTEHWMAGWAEWLEQQARPSLGAVGETE